MITFLIASVVMAAVFVMYTQATDSFRKEEDAVATQSQLRFAMDHIKNDVRKAGFHATPHSVKDGLVCAGPRQTAIFSDFRLHPPRGFVHESGLNQNVIPLLAYRFWRLFLQQLERVLCVPGGFVRKCVHGPVGPGTRKSDPSRV